MKKLICLFLILILLLTTAGCGSLGEKDERIQVICTVFPQYDWARNIIGENTDRINLTLLMDNGADLHNYQASVADLAAIAACDLFIYIGGGSDEWAEDALEAPANPNRKTLALLSTIEPICADHDHDHDHEEEHHTEDYDEHLWLSLKNAEIGVQKIAALLQEIDPDGKETYAANAETYLKKITDLESQYATAVAGAARKTLLFADRFPFTYLARDYGLTYYAAFSGCSAETEASFATISMLAQKTDELNLPAILVIETSDQSIAKTVIQNSSNKEREILVMDSLQSVTQKRIEDGETYLSIMEKNLTILKKALY